MSRIDWIRLASTILGFAAAGCVLAIGGYIAAWCLNIYASGLGGDFLVLAIVTWVFILTSLLLLVYGSAKIIRKSMRKGGIMNLIAGVEMIAIFLYFYVYFPLLPQFGYVGLLLFLPALLSGIAGLSTLARSKKQEPINKI
jgi:hypothetical protein